MHNIGWLIRSLHHFDLLSHALQLTSRLQHQSRYICSFQFLSLLQQHLLSIMTEFAKRGIFWDNLSHQLSTTSFPFFCISCLPACRPISFPCPAPWLPSALWHFYCTLPPPPGWGAWRPDFCIFVPGLGSCMPTAPLLASPHLHPLIISVIISVITIGLKLECRQCTVRWRPWEMLGIASLLWPSHQDNFLSSSSESSWENCLTH